MKVRLTEVCHINMGQSPDSSSYNEVGEGLPFFQGNADFGILHPNVRVWCSLPIKIAQEKDLLISVRAPIGALNIANVRCCIGRGLAALTVDEKRCVSRYLWYVLKSKRDELNRQGTGSTFKAISKKVLEEVSFMLPSVGNQIEIVKRLDKVDSLIGVHKEEIKRMDLLIKSRFIEMFGLPNNNIKGWDVAVIGDVASDVSYGTSKASDKDGTYAYLRMNNITYDGDLDLRDLKYINLTDEEFDKYGVKTGDLLFNRTNSRDLVGKTCVYNLSEPMAIAGYIIRVRFNKLIKAEYVSVFLNSQYGKAFLSSICKGAVGQANISAKELKNITILVPPIELQDEFIMLKKQVDKSKLAIQKSLDKLEILQKSLMQQYFG